MSSPHALIIRRVRIEVRENWCQTSSFHSHPETKWHSDYGLQSEVPRLHMHRRDVFWNQSNQASLSCGSARIRVPDEPAPFSAGSLGGSTVWRWRMGCTAHYTAAVIQDSLVLWNTIISGDSGSVSQHTWTVCVLIDFIGGVRWAGSVLSGSCNARELIGRGEMCVYR